jgi:hypothetical protein
MNIEEYEDIADGIEVSKLLGIYDVFFKEVKHEEKDVTLKKLEILCDKQWHTYELPSSYIQSKIKEWLIENWEINNDYLDVVLGVSYCFGLDKGLYEKALSLYKGEFFDEYKENLTNSKGVFIDPYWSMPKKT